MSQTAAPQINMTKGYTGQLADSHAPKDVVSGKATAAAIKFGYLAVIDTANGDGAVMPPAVTGDITNKTVGIVMASQSLESSLSGDPQYGRYSAVPVLRRGRVWVSVENAVAEGGLVYARHTADFGRFRADTDTGAATLVPGAVYRTSTTGAGLAVVEINLP